MNQFVVHDPYRSAMLRRQPIPSFSIEALLATDKWTHDSSRPRKLIWERESELYGPLSNSSIWNSSILVYLYIYYILVPFLCVCGERKQGGNSTEGQLYTGLDFRASDFSF